MTLPIVRRKRKDEEPGRMLSPFQQRLSVLDDLENRLFDGDFWRPFGLITDELERGMQRWMPKTDVAETDKEMVITANIPGVKPDDVKVEVDNHALVITGKTEEEKEEKGKKWYRVEREYGELYRRFELPDNVDAEQVNARIQNGTLKVTIPKKPSAAPKQIEVQKD